MFEETNNAWGYFLSRGVGSLTILPKNTAVTLRIVSKKHLED